MSKRPRAFLALSTFFAAIFFVACATARDTEPTTVATAPTAPATATAEPTAGVIESVVTPADPDTSFRLDPEGPSGERIYDLVEALSVDIGPRPTGSDKERAAASYAADLLHSFGYDVQLQEFSIGSESSRTSTLSVSGGAQNIVSVPFAYSAAGEARGRLVYGGLGSPDELPADVAGAILLLERGELTFREKVDAAADAGALGVIVFNNEREIFYGTLNSLASLPAVAISQREGQALLDQIAAGPVEVSLKVDDLSDATSFNVIARPPGRDCETVSGGHYDSVQVAPGASDNATGSATVLEIAAVLADRGEMDGNCFILWGAEEIGLVGSRAYVASLTPAERKRIRAMLNFDMVGVGDDGWLLIGDPTLQRLAQSEADDLGIATRIGQLPSNASSDHASFLDAGIPAVMFHRTSDPLLHTPEDVVSRVRPELLEEAARMGIALLEALNGQA